MVYTTECDQSGKDQWLVQIEYRFKLVRARRLGCEWLYTRDNSGKDKWLV